MIAHVLLNLLNQFGKEIKREVCRKTLLIFSLCTQRCYGRHNVS